jgi:hypothetical protein
VSTTQALVFAAGVVCGYWICFFVMLAAFWRGQRR